MCAQPDPRLLAELTALCADKLRIEGGSPKLSHVSTDEFDTLALELSRVAEEHREEMLKKWWALRVQEIVMEYQAPPPVTNRHE